MRQPPQAVTCPPYIDRLRRTLPTDILERTTPYLVRLRDKRLISYDCVTTRLTGRVDTAVSEAAQHRDRRDLDAAATDTGSLLGRSRRMTRTCEYQGALVLFRGEPSPQQLRLTGRLDKAFQ
jgi:hypothetical protein